MAKQEALEQLKKFDQPALLKWLADFGLYLTICARTGYPVGDAPGNISPLIGMNELQHQVYGKVRCLQRGDEWPLEEFLDTLFQKAAHYKVDGDFGWALTRTLIPPQ
jgi:hypothetical protein